MNPIYAIEKDYVENAQNGPFFQGKIPPRIVPPKEEWVDFLGYKIATPIGVPAGPLLNSRFVLFAAEMGFDVVTYKTIRSQKHPAHPLPNMIYVQTNGDLTQERIQDTLFQAKEKPKTLQELACTNSFGIPSQDPDFLIADIATAKNGLSEGQVLIVSVVGTPRENEDYVEDFAATARVAVKGGAPIIEADLSCPNLAGNEGSLFANPDSVFKITTCIKKTIHDLPLVVKVGAIFDKELLKSVMIAAKKGGASAICGINTVSMKIVKEDGTAALGESRLKAGVCGSPIRKAALHFIQMASLINQSERLGLTIMGTGGVVHPSHFDEFLDAGADIAMSALGMMWDPFLAHRRATCLTNLS